MTCSRSPLGALRDAFSCSVVSYGTPFFDFVIFLVVRLEVYKNLCLVELCVLFEKGFVAVPYGLEWK